MEITLLPALAPASKARGFSLVYGDYKYKTTDAAGNCRLSPSPIQLWLKTGEENNCVLEVSDLGRMHEIQTYLNAFELGFGLGEGAHNG